MVAACIISVAILVLCTRSSAPLAPSVAPGFDSKDPTLGASASISVVLDRPDYSATPQDYNAPMWVQIEQVEPLNDGRFLYRISYTGLETGVFNITDYLQKSPTARLSEPIVAVAVRSVIPKRALSDFGEPPGVVRRKAFPYQRLLGVLGAIWLGWGLWLLRQRRQSAQSPCSDEKPTVSEQTAPAPPPRRQQVLANVLQPLVEKAAIKTISTKEKALLERILLLFWGQKLELDHLNDAEQLRRILAEEEAGALLRTIEDWLYQPASEISAETIEETLTPYQKDYVEDFPHLRELVARTTLTEKRLVTHA